MSGARRAQAASIVGISARTLERWRHAEVGDDGRMGPKSEPPNKLGSAERKRVLEVANSEAFRNLSPKQIVPALADQGLYIASESTFYRVLREEDQMSHRAPSRAPSPKPRELSTTAPNQVYTWDITYLPAAIRGQFFFLYLFMDIFSRKIVGWKVHEEESMELSADLIEQVCADEGIEPDTLALHADNGGPMKGSTMLATLQRLGVMASFSRASVSDDNAYSEAIFRTLKYRPKYPRRFESLEAARTWIAGFVDWYNNEHLHSGIKFVTPADKHAGLDVEILARRRELYEDARRRNPKRWSGDVRNWTPVSRVVLNPESAQRRAA